MSYLMPFLSPHGRDNCSSQCRKIAVSRSANCPEANFQESASASAPPSWKPKSMKFVLHTTRNLISFDGQDCWFEMQSVALKYHAFVPTLCHVHQERLACTCKRNFGV